MTTYFVSEGCIIYTSSWCRGLVPGGGGRGGEGTLIFSYIRRLGSFFLLKILNFNIFGGFSEKNIFFVYENFVDIFWGSSQNWTIFSGHFYAF